MNPIIVINDVTKSYGAHVAVRDLNLAIEPGEFFGFLGPNGAGKTTTIRLLTGLIEPDKGEITVGGIENTDRMSVASISGVMPESRGFYLWMTAEEYLEFFAGLYGVKDTDKVVRGLLDQVGLTERKHSRIATFSRGMKQRLGLARSLINSPKILFLDEPTLGLDPKGQEDIQNLLRDLNEEGVTIFYSSHLLSEVAVLCTRVGIINHGTLVADGDIGELQKQAHVENSNLTDIFLALTRT
jgi:ABC-2 type transport system ATP-binding protein